jgi:8-oxo-dGTP pyrophosphatase MutT (NUDIX family)
VSGINVCGCEITLDTICQRLSEKQHARPTSSRNQYRAAAVLIPLVCFDNRWHLLYTRRTDLVQDHKGQVSFPGGAVEENDNSREETALREVYEEIGVRANEIRILGRLAEMQTITGYMITPVVGYMNWPLKLRLSHAEVSRAFIVPLDWLANRANHTETEMVLPDGRREKVVHFDLFEGEKIWGATARLTLNFLNTIF